MLSCTMSDFIPLATARNLNAANADLENLVGTMDLSITPDVTPIINASVPAPVDCQSRPTSEYLAPAVPASAVRRASYPEPNHSSSANLSVETITSSTSSQPLRRASGSAITHQVAAWPPVAPVNNPTSSSQNDPILAAILPIRERTRTSSSTSSVPPSAFNRKQLTSDANEAVPSLTLKTLRATRGHVLQKAKYYGDLDREAKNAELALRNRKMSCDDGNRTGLAPPVRTRPVSFSGVDAEKERDGLMPPVDVVTDIPEELRNILVQRSSLDIPESTQDISKDDASVVALPSSDVPTPTTGTTGTTQEFVYTGVDAASQEVKQHIKAAPSLAHSSEYSLCQDFSSYDEVSKPGLAPSKQPELAPVASSADVFLENPPIKTRPTHKVQSSVISVESAASYCVVTQHPELPSIPPLVIHGRHSSVESTGLSADDTFSFASKPFPGVIRAGHRRTKSVMSVSPEPSRRNVNRGSRGNGDSRLSFSALARPDMGDKMFSSGLPDIMASPISHRSFDLTASEPTSPVSPDTGFTSSESFFDSPRHRVSSSSTTVASVFGLGAGEKGSKGNLFGPQRPMSLVSNFTDTSMLSDEGSRTTLECLDGERISSKVLDQLSPCDLNKRKRVVAKRNALPSFEPPTKELAPKPTIDLNVVDKLLNAEIATASTGLLKSRSLGHRRARTVLSRPLTINVEPIHEGQEDLPGLYHSHSRSRGSSSTSAAVSSQVDSSDSAVAIAEADPETTMVLRRYYTLQREAQSEIDQSRQLWEDTAFSADELSGKRLFAPLVLILIIIFSQLSNPQSNPTK